MAPVLRHIDSTFRRNASAVYLVGILQFIFLPSLVPDTVFWTTASKVTVIVAATYFLWWAAGFERIILLGIGLGVMVVVGAMGLTGVLLVRVAEILTALLLLYSLYWLFRTIARSGPVSRDTIIAAVVGYLALGSISRILLFLLEEEHPGSFVLASDPGIAPDLLYFSFVTLTTLGYGDVVPTTEVARSLAVWIALAGQLYLTIVIALLVGRYLAGSVPGTDDRTRDRVG
ncbi:MAG: two pore domain potassium channel family protein [Flavobacteriales bacterium]|nr:two pore domain potassium channel family protein [Flavobacteriales bacterium]